MAAWMAEFMKYLPYSNAALAGDGAGVVDALKAAICEDVNLLLEKSEDEFAPYLRDFATAVWQQLVAVGTEPGQDALATEALRFLTTIASGVHHALFAEPATLRLLCENIIIPNLQFRAADEELFEDNRCDTTLRAAPACPL